MTDKTAAASWRTASYSNGSGNCVEAGNGSGVLVRDTKDRTGAVLNFSPAAWRKFTWGLKRGLRILPQVQGASARPRPTRPGEPRSWRPVLPGS